MEDQHSHSLRDTKHAQTGNQVQFIDQNRLALTVLFTILLVIAIIMVLLNHESILGRGALALSVLALGSLVYPANLRDKLSQ